MNTTKRLCIAATALAVMATLLAPKSLADQTSDTAAATTRPKSRVPAADPLNGGFLLLNMHGMLFHPDTSDIAEDLGYARWLGGGVIRVFATDNNGAHEWDGTRVGARIAEIAPMLRAQHLRLIVAFVNNHRDIPNDAPDSTGWMDNYVQLLLPFYTQNWRGAYQQFVRDLISTVNAYNAQDVIFAWELGNELHTPRQPEALIPFITQAAAVVRELDSVTPILPGTMGANHVEPGHPDSAIARWLYCDAPVDAYTLHAYDWVSRQRPGDMPIDWDLDNIVSQPCSNGRALPVIVEELGTSRALPGVYSADDELGRFQQEQRQIQFVRQFPQVVGFGVWNAESPRLVDRTFIDVRRGLTSYGPTAQGGGSCYDPAPDVGPGFRCKYEQLLRSSYFLRVGASSDWSPGPDANGSNVLVGGVDPVASNDANPPTMTLNGWLVDPAAAASPGIDALNVYVGNDLRLPVAGATLGLARNLDNSDWTGAGFSINLPLQGLPTGVTSLTLAAHSVERGTWFSTLGLVVPTLGAVPPRAPLAPANTAPAPIVLPAPLRAEVASPQPGDQVSRSFVVQVLASGADHVDIFLEPDRDDGGHLIGSSTLPGGGLFKVTVNTPLEGHTLYVHVSSTSTRQEQVLTVPIIVRS